MKLFQKHFFSFFIMFYIINVSLCASHDKKEWMSRSIYQIITDRFENPDYNNTKCDLRSEFCGGTFKGIISKLDYIKNMGFDAIWISPPMGGDENAYHGYHNVDLYKTNGHFGTEDELKQLVSECHKKDIWVILDVVPNHMKTLPKEDYHKFVPFDKWEYFHHINCTNYDDNNPYYVENCEVWGLPDLDQNNTYVKEELIKWLKDTINKYDFDAVKYSDARNVPKWFWRNYSDEAKTYTFGIIDKSDLDGAKYIADYLNYMDGIGDYPLYYHIRESFCSGNMRNLNDYIVLSNDIFNDDTKEFDSKYNVIFLGNHDKQRFLYECKNKTCFRNSIVFIFFYPGIPIFYYGDEQDLDEGGDWGDDGRLLLFGKHNSESNTYKLISKVNEIRKEYKTYSKVLVRRYVDNDFYAFTKGEVLVIVGNGKSKEITIKNLEFLDGDKYCNLLGAGDCVIIKDSQIITKMEGEPKVFVRDSSYNSASGILCSSLKYLFYFILLLV